MKMVRRFDRREIVSPGTYHFILVEQFNDDRRWILLDFLADPVNEDAVEYQELVPRRTQRFVDHLRGFAELTANHSCERIRETGRVATDQRSGLIHVRSQLEFLFDNHWNILVNESHEFLIRRCTWKLLRSTIVPTIYASS